MKLMDVLGIYSICQRTKILMMISEFYDPNNSIAVEDAATYIGYFKMLRNHIKDQWAQDINTTKYA